MWNRGFLALSMIATLACATAGEEDPADGGAVGNTDGTRFDAAPFAPVQISGLVLWLDGNNGVTTGDSAQVMIWTDQSSKGNHATPGPTPPQIISQLANGLPAIRFDGAKTFLQLPDSDSLRFGTGDFTVLVVARARSSAIGMLFGKSLQTTPFAGPNLFVNFSVPAASTKLGAQVDSNHYALSTSAGLNDDKFHLFGMRRTGSTLEVRVNGLAEGNVPMAGVDASAMGAQPTIGGQAKIVQMLEGDVAEVIAVKGSISDADLTALEGFLRQKYALH